MKLLLFAGLLAGCLSDPTLYTTMLIHPATGERVSCNAFVNQWGWAERQEPRINCVKQYEALGFIQADQLTPEQRATIIPKSRPLVIEQK
jgi:hypothetical protein